LADYETYLQILEAGQAPAAADVKMSNAAQPLPLSDFSSESFVKSVNRAYVDAEEEPLQN